MIDREKYLVACDIIEASYELAADQDVPSTEFIAALTSSLGTLAGMSLRPERFDAGLENIITALRKSAESVRDNGQA